MGPEKEKGERVVDRGKEETARWVLHIIGPDDVIGQTDELTALREANKLNIGMAQWHAKYPSENNPYCWAVVKDATKEDV